MKATLCEEGERSTRTDPLQKKNLKNSRYRHPRQRSQGPKPPYMICTRLEPLPPLIWFCLFVCLRVVFLLKTDSWYPKDTGVTLFTLEYNGNPFHYLTPQLAPVSAPLLL